MELIQLLQGSPAALMATIGILGLVVGSFLNVVILRLPVMMEREWRQQCVEFLSEQGQSIQDEATQERFDLITPRSHCPSCGHRIRALENIPVLSYLFLHGRCSKCAQPISARYPIIEAVCATLSMVVAWKLAFGWPMLAALILTWALLALTVIDIDHQLLPDNITLPLLWLGLLLSLAEVFTNTHDAIIGAATGYLSLWSIFKLFKWLTGKEGMGYGDFKLLALLGAWMGWQSVLPVILLSSVVGAAVGITMIMVMGRDRNIPIPFGPYLASAGWIYLLWGEDIIRTYLTMLGLPSA